MRVLTDFEVKLLKDVERAGKYPVGGVLDETLEMFCNSYGLIQQDELYTEDRPLASWVMTDTGRYVLAMLERDELKAENAALKARIRELEENNADLFTQMEAEVKRADEWQGIAVRRGQRVAELEQLLVSRDNDVRLQQEKGQRRGDVIVAIRHEVMQFPMDKPAYDLVQMLDRMTKPPV